MKNKSSIFINEIEELLEIAHLKDAALGNDALEYFLDQKHCVTNFWTWRNSQLKFKICSLCTKCLISNGIQILVLFC